MNDCFGRKIKIGDIVAYASNCNGPMLNVGEVLGYTVNGSGKVRVRVFKSSHNSFVYGRKNYRTGKWTRKPGEPYVTTISMPNRVIIISEAVPRT